MSQNLLQQYAAVGNYFPLVIVTDVEKADSTVLTPKQNNRAWNGMESRCILKNRRPCVYTNLE
jgi:predicted Zn-dependent protease